MGPNIYSKIETLARRLLPRHRANAPGQPRRGAGTFSFWHPPETGVTIGRKTIFRSRLMWIACCLDQRVVEVVIRD
jgi:hypothetical protein